MSARRRNVVPLPKFVPVRVVRPLRRTVYDVFVRRLRNLRHTRAKQVAERAPLHPPLNAQRVARLDVQQNDVRPHKHKRLAVRVPPLVNHAQRAIERVVPPPHKPVPPERLLTRRYVVRPQPRLLPLDGAHAHPNRPPRQKPLPFRVVYQHAPKQPRAPKQLKPPLQHLPHRL